MLAHRLQASVGSRCRSVRQAAPLHVRPSARKLILLNVATLQRSDNTLNNIMSAQSLTPALSTGEDFRICTNIEAAQIPAALRKECVLFYTPDTEELAQKVALQAGGAITLGRIKWKKFADGFPDLFVENATSIRNRHVAFLASFNNPTVIFEQISVIYALPRLFVSSFTLVLPFFPTGTMERVETEGDIATANTLARLLSNVPPSRGGPTSLVIFDIHALQERFYFGDAVLPLFESGVPLLLERLRQLPDKESITIAYPDEGAWKRFHYQFKSEGYPEVICTKVRDGSKRIVRLKEGEPKDRHVVIVDDLVQSGGTLIECHALLASLGAKHVSAFVTHGVFPNMSWVKFRADMGSGAQDGFRYFWLSDSCPQTVRDVRNKAPFEVLSLAGPIAAALQI
ncbi:ribose phosphate diphosphokinase subunit prs4 [Pleodorina starrii]|uniref:ribose-phosphate diphosphokinase n=1 Tax=Pleodorina starrii TaxID=330485 RepID=A0A9W6BUQ0_9CHLO|nr:ribose phosphate diphosphokinase subunit prs4 [Pleodorina starrii]GLC58538.1 ribose phosphate diphosphokinase subunit prs4 [Pleodorina starrii]GLC74190.1 ribose phosphate diphosphokinase subunit prs4 [Pleodorina starrii]